MLLFKKTMSVDKVCSLLNRKRDLMVDQQNKHIRMNSGNNPEKPRVGDCGNGTFGKIDFLVNYCGFTFSEY